MTTRVELCRYCDAEADSSRICQDCRRNMRLPSKIKRKPAPATH